MSTGVLGVSTSWEAGTDVLTFPLDASNRNGVQLAVNGFSLEDATIEVRPNGANSWVTVATAEGAASASIYAEGFSLSGIRLSGVTAGDYTVCASQ